MKWMSAVVGVAMALLAGSALARGERSAPGCNGYGCWEAGGGCNGYGCWKNGGGCNGYGCWNSPQGSCNGYGCSEVGTCTGFGCPSGEAKEEKRDRRDHHEGSGAVSCFEGDLRVTLTPAGCNGYGCWEAGGGCNGYGCWKNAGGCNGYGCWNSAHGECNGYGCSDVGACNGYGCPKGRAPAIRCTRE